MKGDISTPPGGRRGKMKNVSIPAMICVAKNNKERNTDVQKNTKSKHTVYASRLIIERKWNQMIDSRTHLSVREIAKQLAIPESTLRYELKHGCSEGVFCMYLPLEHRYQYFPYSADLAEQNTMLLASNKGARMKITNHFVTQFEEYLEEWRSIPAAYQMMLNEHPEWKGRNPSLRTIYYHATTTLASSEAFTKYYREYHHRKQKKDVEVAKNHKPEHTIEHLPKEVREGKPIGYFQMDLVVSGTKGKGGLLVLANPGYKEFIFIRKINDLRRKTVHRALRSIVKETTEKGITITHILTDNGTEFTDTKKVEKITRAMLFYTHAYAAWEKGYVENSNRLIRRFYPKTTDFSRLIAKDIAILQYKLAHYPRSSQIKQEGAA